MASTLGRHDADHASEKTIGDDVVQHEAAESGQKPVESEPDGGYGWVCVGAVALMNMHSWGLNSSYGVFLAHFIDNNTFPGATYLDFAFIGGLSVSIALLLAPVATFTIRQFGTRIALLFGVFFETLALIAASFSTKIWHLFLTQGVCFGLGLGFLYIASVGIIPQWFNKKRSFANALGAAGSGIGGLVYNLASQAVIARAGFGWAYRTIGIISCVVNLCCALLIRDRNKAIGARFNLFEYQLFRRKEFNLFQAWGFMSMLGYLVLIYSLPDYATSVGLTAQQGSIVGALLNLGQAIGRPFVGIFSDRVGRINIASTLTALCGVMCLVWWIFAKSFGALLAFALVVGTTSGTYWATVAPVGAEVIGLKDLPSALSLTWLVLVLPCTFSEVMALEIESNTSYLYAQIYTGLCYIAAALCLWGVRIWKVGELEKMAAKEGKPVDVVGAIHTEAPTEEGLNDRAYTTSSALRRAVMWRRV